LYKPNIALLSGIAWDHINVFPTFDGYIEQFRIFTDSLTNGGIMVYNEEDKTLKEVVESSEHTIKKYSYSTPLHTIENGITLIDTPDGQMPLEIFGDHNLQNLAGAKWICQHMGIDEEDFYEAIASFKGASKRLEKIAENKQTVIFKDFAHSPSKVQATTEAVKKQYAQKDLIACLELHTYSSLNAKFLGEYKGALNKADKAVVFYSPHAVKIKQLDAVTKEQIAHAFDRDDLIIYTDPEDFKAFIFSLNLNNKAIILMSSGNYGGLDFEEVKILI
jgi:UDP-N-acetylmuramate: L-alanyl-gamma-D-glutamyl-meso-diaminopimelate ligase